MSDYSTNDNFEDILSDDFFSSKQTFTHFYIDADLSDLPDTKTKLKEMGCIWSTAYKKYVAVVSHRSQVETLLKAKQIAFSLEYTSDPFVSSDKKEISVHNQIDIITEQIVKEDEKITLLAYTLKLETDDFEKEPLLGDAFYAKKHDGYELCKSVANKKALREELYAKLDGMHKVVIQPLKAELFPFTILNAKQLLATTDEEWIVDEILLRTDISMIYGAPGCGKTFIALDLIGSAITGRKWAEKFNIKKPLNVAYSTGEGLGSVRQRFNALFTRYEIDVDQLENFSFLGEVPQLFEMQDPKNMNIFIEQWLSGVKSGLQKSLDILFIDTLHTASLGSNENCTKDMGLVINMCRQAQKKLGCAVVLIHHSSKDGSTERGSSSLRGGMDCMIEVKNGSMHCSKTKHGTFWQPIAFNLVKVLGTTNVAVEWKEYSPPSSDEDEDTKENKNWLVKVLKFFNNNKGKFYTAQQISNELGWNSNFWSKVLKEGLKQGVYSTSAVDPSKSVYSKNPQTYGIN